MPVGTHPIHNDQGQLIGILVAMQPAQGSPTISLPDIDENGDPVSRQFPNPEYVTAEFATKMALETAIANQGVEVNVEGGECREVWFSGVTEEESANGNIRVVASIRVGDTNETARRAAIDIALAQFAPT